MLEHRSFLLWGSSFILLCCSCSIFYEEDLSLSAPIRTITYLGIEVPVFIEPEQPTIVAFPGVIESQFWQDSLLSKTAIENNLTLYGWLDSPQQGETIEVILADGRIFRLWVVPADSKHRRDLRVKIIEGRSLRQMRNEKRNRWQSQY